MKSLSRLAFWFLFVYKCGRQSQGVSQPVDHVIRVYFGTITWDGKFAGAIRNRRAHSDGMAPKRKGYNWSDPVGSPVLKHPPKRKYIEIECTSIRRYNVANRTERGAIRYLHAISQG